MPTELTILGKVCRPEHWTDGVYFWRFETDHFNGTVYSTGEWATMFYDAEYAPTTDPEPAPADAAGAAERVESAVVGHLRGIKASLPKAAWERVVAE